MPARLTAEEFIAKAEAKHTGRGYDYSHVKYVNGNTKVEIRCPVHGPFFQTARVHLGGCGCPECAKMARMDTCFELYGNRIAANTEEGVSKKHEVMLKKYGAISCFGLPETQAKSRETVRKRYGVDNPMQSREVLKKAQATNLERYGFVCSAQNPDVKKKQVETLKQHYNVDNPMVSPVIKDRAKKTCLEHYGVDNPMKSDVINEKVKRTVNERYHTDYVVQAPEIREKIRQSYLERYGTDNPMKNKEVHDKAVAKFKELYGVSNPLQNRAIVAKVYETRKQNGTLNTSQSEDQVYELLCRKFGRDFVYREHKSKRYPYHCDFYLKALDLFIECNFSWTHGGHFFDENNIQDLQQLNMWMNKAENSRYYRNAVHVWTETDVEKKSIAEQNHLNYLVFWDNDLRDFMEWYNSL